ncbi:MAG: hypothetical protein ACFCD0_14410 [Gemmataceae bacterium]
MSRRRKNHLKVSTFPFIAVLLCAMGALILLLLIMDRQARLAARMKATQEAEKLRRAELAARNDEEKEKAAEREKALREAEAKRQQRLEWERQRREREKQRRELRVQRLAQMKAIEEKLAQISQQDAQATKELRALTKRYQALYRQLSVEDQKTKALQAHLAKLRAALATKDATTTGTHASLKQAKQEVAKLDAKLKQLKQAKSRAVRSYSLIPYAGPKGENRKPIYIECRQNGIVLHPEKVALEGARFRPGLLDLHLNERLVKYETRVNGKTHKPYIFFLVRPEGLKSYYSAKEFVSKMEIDFGYELIEQDWVVDVSGKGATFRTKKTEVSPIIPKGSGLAHTGRNGTNPSSQAEMDIPRLVETNQGIRIQRRTPYGTVWTPKPKADRQLGSQGGTSPFAVGNGGTQQGFLVDFAPTGRRQNRPSDPKKGNGSGSRLGQTEAAQGELLVPPRTDRETGSKGEIQKRDRRGTNGKPRTDEKPPKVPPNEFRDPRPKTARGTRAGQSQGSHPQGKRPQKPQQRHVRRDWIIPVVCKETGASVPHLRQRFPTSSFVRSKTVHPMVQGIYDLIRRRHKRLRPGEPMFRPVIRFEVHPDGLRTFQGASLLLEVLGVAMQRENILPDRPRLSEYYRKE